MTVKKATAEMFGTFILVLVGCGSAVLAGSQIGNLGVGLAFGLTLLFLVYSIGPISGCHVNPAVTLAILMMKKIDVKVAVWYIGAQLIGGVLAGYALYYIAQGSPSFILSKGFALNGYGSHSPHGYSMMTCLVMETICTTLLLLAVLATTKSSFPAQMSGLVIGLTLVLVHLLSIPVTNTSVNFARSLATAVVYKSWALTELWLFASAQVIAVVGSVATHKHLTNGIK